MSKVTPASKTAEQKPMRRACLQKQLRKTKLCTYHSKGACQFGEECAFAHCASEIQDVPDLRKTRLCKAFQEGNCTNEDCTFAHGESELRSTDMFFKKTLCFWNDKGKCRSGNLCRFAHSLAELKAHAAASGEETPTAAGDAGTNKEDMMALSHDSCSHKGAAATKPRRQKGQAVVPEVLVKAYKEENLKEEGKTELETATAAEPMKIYQANCADVGLAALAPAAGGDQVQATLETLKQNILQLTAQWSNLQQALQVQQQAGYTGGVPPPNHVSAAPWNGAYVDAPPLFPDYQEQFYITAPEQDDDHLLPPPPPGLGDAPMGMYFNNSSMKDNSKGLDHDLDYGLDWDFLQKAIGA